MSIITIQEFSYIIVQHSKSIFYKATLNIKAAQTKNYNVGTGFWIRTKFDANVAESLLCARSEELWAKVFFSHNIYERKSVFPHADTRNLKLL